MNNPKDWARAPMTFTTEGFHFCERCGERLNEDRAVWLELNSNTGRYHPEGCVDSDCSQGCFPFGKACSEAVLKAGGVNKKIREAAL